jgi:hypothetical protein
MSEMILHSDSQQHRAHNSKAKANSAPTTIPATPPADRGLLWKTIIFISNCKISASQLYLDDCFDEAVGNESEVAELELGGVGKMVGAGEIIGEGTIVSVGVSLTDT